MGLRHKMASFTTCRDISAYYEAIAVITQYVYQDSKTLVTSVMRVRSDAFGDPIFQNGLQNQPSFRIISVLGCFAQLCQLVAKCKKWTFKVNFLCQKSSESFSFFFSLKDTNLEAHFLLLAFFDKINFLTTLLLKLGQIFDEVAKLGKSTQDAYNPGKWLIL